MLRSFSHLVNKRLSTSLDTARAKWQSGQVATWALYTSETFLIGHVIFQYGIEVGTPFGISMLPTLPEEGEAILIDKTCSGGRKIGVGDLVTFDHPVSEVRALKRVVGMPGDFVLAGTPYAAGGVLEDMMIQVPKGHCFVAGDNQQWSRDSRVFGPLPLPLIRGKVQATLWPPSRFGWIRNGLQDYEIDRDPESA